MMLMKMMIMVVMFSYFLFNLRKKCASHWLYESSYGLGCVYNYIKFGENERNCFVRLY